MGGSNFRVVIVGGSISGLSLALMLEKNGIDFVVLEAYPEIAPQLGASIALLPNGFRIIDQLGCYEDVLKCGQYPVDEFLIHDTNGKFLVGARNLLREVVDRHGYPLLFFERRQLVQILYDHIKSKEKVLTSKRVKSVEEKDEKVTVTTEDGAVFEGDLVIGADGMHSAIRGEIERKAAKPVDLRTDTLPADHGGVFGISEGDLKSPKGSVTICARKGTSLFVASGPDNRTYWCVFFKLDKRYYGNDTPCRGEKAEQEFSKKYWDHPITENYKYSDLRKSALAAVCTPLHEYIIENWHSGRCMIIGDSVHKVNPIAGQGGNAALETSAALTNALVKLLQSNGSEKIPREKLDAMLEDVQELRKPRTSFLCKESAMMQELYSEASPFFMVMNRYILPFLGGNAMLKNLCDGYPPAVSLDTLDMPARPRSAPYFDELIREPKSRSIPFTVLISMMLMGLGALSCYLLQGISSINGSFRLVESAVATNFLHELNVPLQSLVDAARFPRLDNICKTIVAAFLPVVSGAADFESKIQAAYFLIGVYVPLLSIMAIEGYRWNNKGTLLWSPSLWTGLAQLLSLGVVFPFYLLVVFFTSRGPGYWMACSQAAPTHKLKALLPGIIIAYLVPSVLMLSLDAQSPLIQRAILFWQATPVLAIGATELLSRAFFTPSSPTTTAAAPPNEKAAAAAAATSTKPTPYLTAPPHRPPLDLAPTRRIHTATAILSATLHIALILYTVTISTTTLSSFPYITLATTFLPPLDALANPTTTLRTPVPTVAAGMSLFFKFDLLLALACALVWSVLTLYDLRRVGLAERGVSATRLALLAAGWVVVGPGAATALLWRWREGVVGGFVPGRMTVAGKGEKETGARARAGSGSVKARWGMGRAREE